jgi:hypothetical protein
MAIKVHILATCLGNLNATLLVFRTLRVGFPSADVTVFGNDLAPAEVGPVQTACVTTKCKFVSIPRMAHDEWTESLLNTSQVPFWICDTDMVFHSSVEDFANGQTVFKGRYEPAFTEPWSGTSKTPRLHTCLLYFNAPALRHCICEWIRKWHPPRFPFSPKIELVRQCYVAKGAGMPPLFQDTCAGLYAALGGESFTDEENAHFDHLHCGTYVDRMRGVIPGLAEAHAEIYERPEASRLLKANQEEFYHRQSYANRL